MNILVLGSGGREHAMVWKIAQSKQLDKLFIGPGNAGTAKLGQNLPINPVNFNQVENACLENKIDILVVGPEAPLVEGIVDYFKASEKLKHIAVIGPSQAASMLEGSKDFAKEFMNKHNIPTANHISVSLESILKGYEFLDSQKAPFVLKADGLAAGKGVLILDDRDEAKEKLDEMLRGKFGKASEVVVIEQFLDGIELSVFVLTDGQSYVILPEAKDYKRIGENNTGLNTGGMGSVSPVPFATPELMNKIEEKVIKPTIEGLKSDELEYKGFVFFGLIKVGDEPYVIEYNVRLGDPETESVMPRIKSDFLQLLKATANVSLAKENIEIDSRTVASVMMVSGGYPESYEKGKVISGLDNIEDSIVFHAGTKVENNSVVTSGGRVLAVCSYADNLCEALKTSYSEIEKISFDKKYYRKDIGFDL